MAKKKSQKIVRIDRVEKYANILIPELLQIDAVYRTSFTISNGSCYILSTPFNNEEIQKFLASQIEISDATFLKGKMKLELYYTEKVI